MQIPDFGDRDDRTALRRLDWATVGGVLVEREMCASLMVVREVADQDTAQVPFTEDEHVIQTLPPDRTMDDPSAMMNEHDENEEDAQADGGNREEVEGDEISDMVVEERPPGLGWGECAASASAETRFARTRRYRA